MMIYGFLPREYFSVISVVSNICNCTVFNNGSFFMGYSPNTNQNIFQIHEKSERISKAYVLYHA